MKNRSSSRSTVRPLTLLAALAMPVAIHSAIARGANEADLVTVPGRIAAAKWLSLAGLNAEILTAAGATPSQVGGVVAAGKEYLSQHLEDLEALQGSVASTAAALAAAPADASNRDSLRAVAESAVAQRDAGLQSLRDACLTELSTACKTLFARILSNREHGVPTKYLVVDRSPDEWAALRNALAATRSSAVDNPGASSARTLIQSADEDSNVTAAAATLAVNLAAASAAWKSALVAEQ